MTKVTFGYIVAGDDKYYINLLRSLKSLEERVKCPYEVLIIDMDNKFYSNEHNIKIINDTTEKIKNLDDPRNWFQPHVWAKRYELYKYLETEYCFYLDVDTVLINDRTEELIEESDNKFMLAQHWWVSTLQSFLDNVKPDISRVKSFFPEDCQTYFYGASGAFLFKKDCHNHIFKKFQQIYKSVFSSECDSKNVTDELILCLSFNQFNDWKFTNGAFNHTAYPKTMPLKRENNLWMGKNPYEKKYEPVFVFHSSYEHVHTLTSEYLEEIKKEMYWEEYQKYGDVIK